MRVVLRLVASRWRSAPGRYVPPVLAVALAAGFVLVALAAGTVAGDQAARVSLSGAGAPARTFRVTFSGVVTTAMESEVRRGVASAGLGGPETESLLLGPVRLSGVVVRPAALAPLAAWVDPALAARVRSCRPGRCPVLVPASAPLAAPGARLVPVARASIASPVPFGYAAGAAGSYPTPVTGDIAGLDALPGLSSDTRSRSWLAVLAPDRTHGWALGTLERRIVAAQARLLSANPSLVLATPLAALDGARAAYATGPREMLPLAGGGAAILLLFVLLAGMSLRREERAELARLSAAGARRAQAGGFVAVNACGVTIAGVMLGVLAGAIGAAMLAGADGEPAGAVIRQSGAAWAILAGVAVLAPCLLSSAVLARTGRAAELSLAALAAALLAGLVGGTSPSGSGALALVCLAAGAGGVIVWGAASSVLSAGVRLTHRARPLTRLALVALGRAASAPGLAVGLAAVGLGLGGFALTVRSTLGRGAADQAAAAVPLDARIDPGADFRRPLALLPATGWAARSGAQVFPVLHATASLAERSGYASVPILGVPAAALPLIHGWRASDASAPLRALAGRMRLPGARIPGPPLPAGTRTLSVGVRSTHLALTVSAVLRDPGGRTRLVALRSAGELAAGRVPAGAWELEAIELAEPTGLEVTTGHQNGENPVGAQEGSVNVTVGPVRFAGGRVRASADLEGWAAVGAAAPRRARRPGGAVAVRFAESGRPGVLRPAQPTDREPLPVLADPATAAAAGPGGRLALSVNGLPVTARVVGTLARFPTAAGGPSLIADTAALSDVLEAGAPGSGLPDELWIAGGGGRGLAGLLRSPPFSSLSVRYRRGEERALQAAPLARTAGRMLLAQAILVALLAVIGIFGFVARRPDTGLVEDLVAQGVAPGGIRALARTRTAVIAAAGLIAGCAVLGLLLGLVIPVTHAIGQAAPAPAYVVVVPPLSLAALWLAVAVGSVVAMVRAR